jgi:hypothetical protein
MRSEAGLPRSCVTDPLTGPARLTQNAWFAGVAADGPMAADGRTTGLVTARAATG